MKSNNFCLFCATQCPPTFKICNGQLLQLEKEKNESVSVKFISNCESVDEPNSKLEAHLKAIFIVRKILNIEDSICAKFLGNYDGQLDPEFWFSVCPSCETLVKEFWEKLQEIGKLERRTQLIRMELKGLIVNSQSSTQAGGRRRGGIVWKEIRQQAVIGACTENLSEDVVAGGDEEDENMNEDSYSDAQSENGEEWVDSGSDCDSEGKSDEEIEAETEELGGSRNGKTKQVTNTPPPSPKRKRKRYYFKCDECGDLSWNMTRFRQHQQLHKLGKGVICTECGWLCQNLPRHVAHWHPAGGERAKTSIEEKMSQRIMKQVKTTEDEDDREELEALQNAYKTIRKAGTKRYFQCNLCPATNSHLKRIQLHLIGHAKGSNGIPCKLCGWVVEADKMEFHIAKVHRPKPKSKGGKGKREDMVKKQSRSYRYSCEECKRYYRSLTELDQHKKLHAAGKGLVCSECGWLVENLSQHKGRLHPKNSKKKQNSKTSSGEKGTEELSRVILVSEELPYYCDHCHMIFPMMSKLLQHLKSFHATQPLLTCSLCQSPLETKQLLQLHLKRAHGEEDKKAKDDENPDEPQECPYCSIKFESKTKKDFHIAKEHQDRLLSCHTCSLSFKTFSDYRKHMDTTQAHGNEKRFSCELCGKAYTDSWALKCHGQQEHYKELGLEPNRCPHCDRVFGAKGSLDYHIRAIHTKQWKFTCEFCGKGFNVRHRMVEHVGRKHEVQG